MPDSVAKEPVASCKDAKRLTATRKKTRQQPFTVGCQTTFEVGPPGFIPEKANPATSVDALAAMQFLLSLYFGLWAYRFSLKYAHMLLHVKSFFQEVPEGLSFHELARKP